MVTKKEREIIVRMHQKSKKQQNIADLIGCSQPTVHKWIQRFKQDRTLDSLPRSGRPTKLTEDILGQLKEKLEKKIKTANNKYCAVSTKEIRDFIKAEIGKKYSIRHVERLMHRLGFSLITPRSQHIRHDQEKVDAFRDEFKKNSKQSMWIMTS